MSLYIKGIDMPSGEGNKLVLQIFPTGEVYDGHGIRLGIREWSEAIQVPPHGRLGDLDKLEQMFSDIDHAPYSGFDGTEPFYSAEDAAQIIRLAPTIIEAEEGE